MESLFKTQIKNELPSVKHKNNNDHVNNVNSNNKNNNNNKK